MDSVDLLPEFLANLIKLQINSHERILVAVSGGSDSMALLHLFLRWDRKRIGVFHLNHGFRAEAANDAIFVQNYAEKYGLNVHVEAYDILSYLAESGESKQQGARIIRYQLMEKCAAEHGYQRIALAHHGDDQAETMLMRMLRGSGLHGLGGIPAQRGILIRPLLSVFKAEILQYCQDFQVPFVDDATNFQPIYLRNKVRQELLPYLAREYNPQIASQLVQLGELARADDEELEQQVEKICQSQASSKFGQIIFPRSEYENLSLALQRRVLRKLVVLYQGHLLRIGFNHIEEWRLQLFNSSTFSLILPGVEVSATRDFIFVGAFQAENWISQQMNVPGITQMGWFKLSAELFASSQLPQPVDNSEDFDLAKLAFPLYVRSRQAGDRIRVFGDGGTKKVKDLFIDAQIPRAMRDSVPLICDQQGILWIPTVRRSDTGKLGDKTTQVVRLSYCQA